MGDRPQIESNKQKIWVPAIIEILKVVLAPAFVAFLTVLLTLNFQVKPQMQLTGLVLRVEQTNVRLVNAERHMDKLEAKGEDTSKLEQARVQANQALLNAVTYLEQGEKSKAASELDESNRILSNNFPGHIFQPRPLDPTKVQ